MPERRGRPKKAAEKVENFRQFMPGQKTEQLAAERAGFGNPETYRQARKVVGKGAPEVIDAMDRGELVFGERRLLAVRDILGWDKIDARVVKVSSIAAGEYAENVIRKDFTLSERHAIQEAITAQIPERRGRPSKQKKPANWPELKAGQETGDIAAQRAGFQSTQEARRVAKVMRNGVPALVEAMDRGELAPSLAAKLAGFGIRTGNLSKIFDKLRRAKRRTGKFPIILGNYQGMKHRISLPAPRSLSEK